MKTRMKVLTVALGIAFFGVDASPLSAQEAPKGGAGGGKMTEEQMRAKARAIAVERCKDRPLTVQANCERVAEQKNYENMKSKQ